MLHTPSTDKSDDKSDSLPLGLTKTETIAILSVLVVIIYLLSMALFVTLTWKYAFVSAYIDWKCIR